MYVLLPQMAQGMMQYFLQLHEEMVAQQELHQDWIQLYDGHISFLHRCSACLLGNDQDLRPYGHILVPILVPMGQIHAQSQFVWAGFLEVEDHVGGGEVGGHVEGGEGVDHVGGGVEEEDVQMQMDWSHGTNCFQQFLEW